MRVPGILVDRIVEAAHLRDNGSAAVVDGLRDREHLADDRLVVHDKIAVRIGSRGPNESNVQGNGFVKQPRAATELQPLNQWLGG